MQTAKTPFWRCLSSRPNALTIKSITYREPDPSILATNPGKIASQPAAIVISGGPMMTLRTDDKPFAEESIKDDVGLRSGAERGTSTVSTRVGRDSVEIDVSALKHLVDTVKAKLRP
jgi:hypothetical protein